MFLGNEFAFYTEVFEMIRPIRILLVFGAVLVSMLRCAGAQQIQVKKTQGRPGEMPVWGPIFETMNRWNALCPGMEETPVTLRITNITSYLKSIQRK